MRAQVRRTLRPSEGRSLLKFDLDASVRALEALPTVAGARFDRAFPHTLRVVVVPERPVAVVRQGAKSYLVAESGRVMATTKARHRPTLARIWIKRDVQLDVGARAEGDLLTAVSAVTPLVGSGFPGRVTSVTATPVNLTIRLRSGPRAPPRRAGGRRPETGRRGAGDPAAHLRHDVPGRRRPGQTRLRNPQLSG